MKLLTRRDLIERASLFAAVPLFGSPLLQASNHALSPLGLAARDAWIFGLPLIEMARARAQLLGNSNCVNQVRHNRTLVSPDNQTVTAPNHDTLYSPIWINVSHKPVHITIPATRGHYFSVTMMDMYTNHFATLSSLTMGKDGGTFTLVGPNVTAADPLAIRSPTPWVWMVARVVVNADNNLGAAHAIQDGFRLHADPEPGPNRAYAERAAPWSLFFESVQALLLENPPRTTDDKMLERMASLGLGPRRTFDPDRFSASQRIEIENGVNAAKAAVHSTARAGQLRDGWLYPKGNLGNFGTDYLYRAQIALRWLGALPPREAMYMEHLNPVGVAGLDSARDWHIRFEREQLPPVDAFWSLSMYRITSAGQYYFFPNPVNRYAIGDRSLGLKIDADGSLTIRMTRENPVGERDANWLPTPPGGPFGLVFRAYHPRTELLNGNYSLPPVQSIERSDGTSENFRF